MSPIASAIVALAKPTVKPKAKNAQKPAEDPVKEPVKEPVKKQHSGSDNDSENGIKAAKTKEELEKPEDHRKSVSSDAEEVLNNIAKTRDLKLKKEVHKAVLHYVGGAQHFLNDKMERTHERWRNMVRIAPRSLLRNLCWDVGELVKERPLHGLMDKYSEKYLAYLVKHGLSSAEDLRRLYADKTPSFGSAKKRAAKERLQKEQDEKPPLVFTRNEKHVKVCVPARDNDGAAKPVKQEAEAPPDKLPKLMPSGDIFASLRTPETIRNAFKNFIMIKGQKYTVENPHPEWKCANRGGKNRFTGVTCDKGKKGDPPRHRPWKVNFCNKTVGRFETILQAAHARLLQKRASMVDLTQV